MTDRLLSLKEQSLLVHFGTVREPPMQKRQLILIAFNGLIYPLFNYCRIGIVVNRLIDLAELIIQFLHAREHLRCGSGSGRAQVFKQSFLKAEYLRAEKHECCADNIAFRFRFLKCAVLAASHEEIDFISLIQTTP